MIAGFGRKGKSVSSCFFFTLSLLLIAVLTANSNDSIQFEHDNHDIVVYYLIATNNRKEISPVVVSRLSKSLESLFSLSGKKRRRNLVLNPFLLIVIKIL